MFWQDPIIAVIDVALSAAVWPMVYRIIKFKQVKSQSLWTSVSISVFMAILAYLYWTLGLVWAGIAHIPTCVVWGVVAVYTVKYRGQAWRPRVTLYDKFMILDEDVDLYYKTKVKLNEQDMAKLPTMWPECLNCGHGRYVYLRVRERMDDTSETGDGLPGS